MTLNARKLYVIDTSVMLYDPESLRSFIGNDVILPLIVLEELDRFKDKQALIGSNARQVNRFLDGLRKLGSLSDGVTIDEMGTAIRVLGDHNEPVDIGSLDSEKGDNKIIIAAMRLCKSHPEQEVKVITKDINLRVKCDALGIHAEDYYRDLPTSMREGNPVYSGQSHVELDSETIDSYYRDGEVSLSESGETLITNQLVVGNSSGIDGNKSLIGIYRNGRIIQPKARLHNSVKIEPRSKEQKAALHLLTDDSVPLVSMTGIAGSGKTFLALVAGMSGLQEKRYDRIIITRSIEPVGRDLGFLPGTMDEKMAPWLMPIVDNFRNAFHDTNWFDMMRQKGVIEVSPIAYIRGRSFSRSYVIVDECQNLTIHELKTLITRCGEGTKMVLLGDTDQVDTPYLDRYSNGLTIAIERLKGQRLFGHIHLDKGERSQLATLGSNVL
jgi:PhoH-like ATPase